MTPPDPPKASSPTASLLDRVRGGDESAWRELVQRYAALVLAVPRERGLQAEDCDEVYQATWIALHRQIDLIRNPDAISTWIVTTARRQTWRLIRARQTRREDGGDVHELGLDGDAVDPAEEAERLEQRGLVRMALARLSSACRRLLEVLYLRTPPASYQEAAVELERPLGSIGPSRMRCLARLATLVEGLRPERG